MLSSGVAIVVYSMEFGDLTTRNFVILVIFLTRWGGRLMQLSKTYKVSPANADLIFYCFITRDLEKYQDAIGAAREVAFKEF